MTAIKKAAGTTAQVTDGALDSLIRNHLTKLANRLPQKYKTVTGLCVTGLSLILWGVFAFLGLFEDTLIDDYALNTAMSVGGSLAGIGVFHKALKAPPPPEPQPMTPIGGN